MEIPDGHTDTEIQNHGFKIDSIVWKYLYFTNKINPLDVCFKIDSIVWKSANASNISSNPNALK